MDPRYDIECYTDLTKELYEYHLANLLSHKPNFIHQLFRLRTDGKTDLQIYSILMRDRVDREYIGNITLSHNNKVGLVGNVFIKEPHRGKSLGTAMMSALEDLAKRDGHWIYVLWVSPIKRPIAYNLYRKFSYVPLHNTGLMIRNFNFDESLFYESSKVKVVPLKWRHLPEINLLTSLGLTDVMITYLFHCYGFATFETEFFNVMLSENTKSWVLENERGVLIAALFLQKDLLWNQQLDSKNQNDICLFDIFYYQKHANLVLNSLRSFVFPKGKIVAYAETGSTKLNLLKNLGFQMEGHFKNHFIWNDKWYDVVIFAMENRK